MSPERATVEVSEATSDDLVSVAHLLRKAWQEAGPGAAGFAGATDAVIDEISRPEALRPLVNSRNRRLFVARDGDRVVGFAATRSLDHETVELAGIIVLIGMAGRGIGTALMDRSIDVCRADGFRRMLVHTETTNEDAIRFYAHLGFESTGTAIDDVEGTDVEVLVMERALDPAESS